MARQHHAGELRQIITWEQKGSTADGMGGNSAGWTTFDSNVPAAVDPVSGKELFAGDQVQFRRTHLVTVKHNPSKILTTAMRGNFGGRLLYIVAIRRTGELGEWIEVDCEERAQD